MNRPTVHDVAREAGVSLATVDRVLNARPGVRDKTIAKVQDAIEKLGYVRDTSAANLARQREYRFAFVLPDGPSQSTDALKLALREAGPRLLIDRVVTTIVKVPSHDPHASARKLTSLSASRFDGVAIMLPETPQVRDAVARLKGDGVAVVALASDLPNSQRDYFIGINSLSAGRTAALLMGRFLGGIGEIMVVTDSIRSRDSLERRFGFDDVVRRDFPDLRVLPSVEAFGDPRRMEEIVERMTLERRQLRGIYSMGPGNRPMLEALRRSGRLHEIVVIAHELTPSTRQALIDNEIAAVIAQNTGHLARSAMRVLRAVCDRTPIFEAQERIRIEIVLRENLPDHAGNFGEREAPS